MHRNYNNEFSLLFKFKICLVDVSAASGVERLAQFIVKQNGLISFKASRKHVIINSSIDHAHKYLRRYCIDFTSEDCKPCT